jgi:hypothetical protein
LSACVVDVMGAVVAADTARGVTVDDGRQQACSEYELTVHRDLLCFEIGVIHRLRHSMLILNQKMWSDLSDVHR